MEKLSVGLTIIDINPAHVRFRLFVALIHDDLSHDRATRASIGGELVLRANEFAPFILRLRPHIIIVGDGLLLPDGLQPLYTEQLARGDWDYDKWVWSINYGN